jgi:hypothetical protein
MSRAFERAERKFELEDLAKLQSAVGEIRASENLRWLMVQLVEISGMARNPFHNDPLTMAFASGKMAAGQDFFAVLGAVDPDLYFDSIKEAEREYARRNQYLADRLSDGRD